jgi:hypothetical protein
MMLLAMLAVGASRSIGRQADLECGGRTAAL